MDWNQVSSSSNRQNIANNSDAFHTKCGKWAENAITIAVAPQNTTNTKHCWLHTHTHTHSSLCRSRSPDVSGIWRANCAVFVWPDKQTPTQISGMFIDTIVWAIDFHCLLANTPFAHMHIAIDGHSRCKKRGTMWMTWLVIHLFLWRCWCWCCSYFGGNLSALAWIYWLCCCCCMQTTCIQSHLSMSQALKPLS